MIEYTNYIYLVLSSIIIFRYMTQLSTNLLLLAINKKLILK